MNNRIIHYFVFVTAVLTISAARAQVIANASFEDWIDSCAVDQAPIGWTNWSDNGGPDKRGTNCIGNIPAYDGTNFMCLRWASGGAFFTEGAATEITGLIPGETYTISFYTRPDDYWSYAGEIFFNFFRDSVNIGNSQPISETGDWQEITFQLTALETTHEISLQVTDGDGSCAFAALVVDNMTISQFVGLEENDLQEKTLVRILDFMGRETDDTSNTLLIYVYSDGSSEKVFNVE